MPKPIRYHADTPAKAVIAELKKLLPHGEGCARDEALALHEQIELAKGTAMDMALATPNASWAMWDLKHLGEETDPKIRKVLLSKILDPMMAFVLYISLPFWNDEEDKILEAKFKGKLSTAEKELVDHIVTRAKENP